MLRAIAEARHQILMSSHIFSGDGNGRSFALALQQAQQRGVQVRVLIMTPYFIPMPVLSRALEAAALRGVKVMLRPAPLAHSKLLVMDDYYSHIGSANIDPRSLRLNFELVVETYSSEFAAVRQPHVDGVRAGCREPRLEVLDTAGRLAWLHNAFCWLFSAYL